jgi:hypothetical protein
VATVSREEVARKQQCVDKDRLQQRRMVG